MITESDRDPNAHMDTSQQEGDAMDSYQPPTRNGLECLLKHLRNSFRIPENLNHYTKKDFRVAEKKYIKYCINQGLSGALLQNSRSFRADR